MFAYTVTATFDDPAAADEWVEWLTTGGHIGEVLVGGAVDAEIVRVVGDKTSIEVRYHFPSREAFARYELNHAPRLRAEGISKFPPTRGIAYSRSTGFVEHRLARADQRQ